MEFEIKFILFFCFRYKRLIDPNTQSHAKGLTNTIGIHLKSS